MKLLTIIIPSYNTESFIDKNMKHFLNKKLYDDIEILLINDGSKDKTAEKASYYEKKYPGYIKVVNKKNGGHGSAINVGVQKAKSKFIKVIDADDWVDTGNLIRLLDDLKHSKEDLIINPYIKIDESSGKQSICGQVKGINNNVTIEFNELKKKYYKLALHSITIKTSILKNNNLRMTEKCYYEDFEYTFYPIPYIKTVRVFNYPVYYYLVGQKTQSVNASNALKNISMYIKVLKDSYEFYEKNKAIIEEKTKIYMEKNLIDFTRSIYNIYLRNGGTREIQSKMLLTDKKLHDISPDIYIKVGKNNPYISIIRNNNHICYSLVSLIFRIYKHKVVQ